MKRCPRCQTDYPDDANWCSLDGGRLQPVAPPTTTPPPSALTMGWDAQPDVTAAATSPSMLAANPIAPVSTPAQSATTPRMPQKPSALTMGWDAQPDPTTPPPTQPPVGGARMPQQPGALTMGWDAQPDPTAQPGAVQQPGSTASAPQAPGALTMGWEIPEDAAQAAVSPAALAAKSVSTSHSPATPAPGTSPTATLIGMQAPWAKTQAAPEPMPAPASSQHVPAPGATAAYGAQQIAQYEQPSMQAGTDAQDPAPQNIYVEPQGQPQHVERQQASSPHADPQQVQSQHAEPQQVQPPRPPPQVHASASSHHPVASVPNATQSGDSALDVPPKNLSWIYALVGVGVIAAIIVLIVFATR